MNYDIDYINDIWICVNDYNEKKTTFHNFLENNYNSVQFDIYEVLNFIKYSEWLKLEFHKNSYDKYYDDYKEKVLKVIEKNFKKNQENYKIKFDDKTRRRWEEKYDISCFSDLRKLKDFKIWIPTNGFEYLKVASKIISKYFYNLRKNNELKTN